MVNPFQIQSILPASSSMSLESQAMGCAVYSSPRRSATSLASSRSNPVYSPLSPMNPIGGKSWSNPTINVPPALSETASDAASLSAFVSSCAVVSSALAEVSSAVCSVSAFVSASVAASFEPPHPARDNAITDARARLKSLFFIINVLLLFRCFKSSGSSRSFDTLSY